MKKNILSVVLITLMTCLLAQPGPAADLLAGKPGGGKPGGGGNGGGGNGGGGNSGGNCGRCGGVLTTMKLRYDGTRQGAEIRIIQKERSKNIVLFEGTVEPGGEISIEGGNRAGTLAPVIHIFVNGKLNTPIPTSCDGIFGAGLKRGDFEVLEATSSEGGKICNEGEGEGEGEEEEEDPCCDGQVDELTLRYNGTEPAEVKITQKDGPRQLTVFKADEVKPGDEITFEGKNKRGTFGSVIQIFVDDKLHTRVHTSCSEPIGPGLERGDFEVVSGTSRNGGDLCPIEDGGGEGEPSTCSACEGQVTDLTLRYIGTEEGATIRVLQQDGKRKNVEVFEDEVAPGATFTIEGATKKGTFGPALRLYVDGKLDTRLHTSCSQPIGPGLVSGHFEVVEGFSREGGRLCEVQSPNE